MSKIFIGISTSDDKSVSFDNGNIVSIEVERHNSKGDTQKFSISDSKAMFKNNPNLQDKIAAAIRLSEIADILKSVDIIQSTIPKENVTTSNNS